MVPIPTLPVLKYILDPIVVHCVAIPDTNNKLPEPSILNWDELYFKVIVFICI